MTNNQPIVRRPIRARDTKWAAAAARWLARAGFRPNGISCLSVVCAGFAGACLIGTLYVGVGLKVALYIAAAAFIQLRLLCNLFDGMVAVEGGFKTKSGEIYNEFPDRISDALIMVGAGYAAGKCGHELGWAAATLSVITAYIRTLGAAAGASQCFYGPMAKQQRMFVMTLASLIAAGEVIADKSFHVLVMTLGIIILGCIVTIIRRTCFVCSELERSGGKV